MDADDDADGRQTLPEISGEDTKIYVQMPPEVVQAEADEAVAALRASLPPLGAEPEHRPITTGTMSPEAVDSVARFISSPGLVAQSGRELDAPSRSLAALELLDAADAAEATDATDDAGEPTEVRVAALPPALPPDVKPATELPSVLLGPPMSTRHDPTERMNAIPATHPLANSIAPGGSAVSTPPARPRRTSRWQVALAAAALLGIGFGASRFLQSRGEHHAASGMPRGEEEEAVPSLPEKRAEPAPAPQPLVTEATTQLAAASTTPTSEQGDAVGGPTRERAQGPRTQGAQRKVEAERAERERGMRVNLGGARLLSREEQAEVAQPSAGVHRAEVVAAMNAMTEQLRSCVGEEHGVADVTLTVRAPGVVSHALVEGAFAGSDKGSCIARALRTAKLPPFEEPVSRIEYPFQL